jgi:hypothetical protein
MSDGNEAELTKEMISNPSKLHTPFEFRVSVHLSAHGLESCFLFVHADFVRSWMYADDAWRETLLEFLCEMRRYRFLWVEDYLG